MFLKSKNKKIYLISFFIISIMFFIPFIIFDLKISIKINQKGLVDHWFSQLFDIYGQLIVFLPIYFCLLLFYFSLSHKYFLNKGLKIFSYIFFQVLSVLVITSLVLNNNMFLKDKKDTEFISSIVFFVLILLACISINIWIVFKQYYKNFYWLNNMNKAASYYILFILLMSLNVEIFKLIFGRPRPREIINNNYEFYYFFEVNFSSNRGKSFPSGHTNSAGLMIGFSYFCYLNNKKYKNIKIIASIIFWILTVATAISRITKLAHFSTDVLFSIFLLIIYYYLSIIIINKIERSLTKHG